MAKARQVRAQVAIPRLSKQTISICDTLSSCKHCISQAQQRIGLQISNPFQSRLSVAVPGLTSNSSRSKNPHQPFLPQKKRRIAEKTLSRIPRLLRGFCRVHFGSEVVPSAGWHSQRGKSPRFRSFQLSPDGDECMLPGCLNFEAHMHKVADRGRCLIVVSF